jgi:SAM-dependent methyltransferase
MKGPPQPRLHLALGLLSVAVIAFQLVLMQILSITQWHHFAYMVISVALLGFGASGTVIALFRRNLLRRMDALLPLLLFASAATMAAVVRTGQALFGGFDSYLLFIDPGQMGRLLLVNLLLAVPFFLGALVIGLIFVRHVERIGTLYFANLLGSGLGGLVGIGLLALLLPQRLPAVTALFTLAAGLLVLPRRDWRLFAAAAVAGLVIATFILYPAPLVLSQYKDLRGVLNLPGARILAERPSPYGLAQAVSAPALRDAPGLSLSYAGPIPERDALFNNGNGFGAVPIWPPAAAPSPLDHVTAALPYALATPKSVLVLHAGSATAVAQALAHGAGKVTAVEPHRAALSLLKEAYPDSAGLLLKHPAVTVASIEPRAFLAADPELYDLIVLPTVGAFGGGAGLFALQEEHTLTVEGIRAMWRRLAADGMLALSVWLDYPPRNPLRLTATLVEALEAEGIEEPSRYLAAVRGWGTVTFCVKRSPLTAADAEEVRAFCRRLQFDPLLLPDLHPLERQRHHRLQDPAFLSELDRILATGREALYEEYPFRLRPATDDRPFFSQFLRWRSLPHLARLFGERAVPFLEMGYLIAVLSFFQMAAAAAVLILLPLLRLGWGDGGRLRTFLYFGGLGVGYMLVEIDLIHRFVLYLGHPVYAASAVICAVLVFSGAGSYASSRLGASDSAPPKAAGIVALLLLLYALILPPLIEQTIALPLPWKALLTLILLAPPSFAMGFPFPLGLHLLSRRREADVPWAWGINGCLSVLSTALATIIAVEAGFTVVFLVAAAAYGTAALSGVRKG